MELYKGSVVTVRKASFSFGLMYSTSWSVHNVTKTGKNMSLGNWVTITNTDFRFVRNFQGEWTAHNGNDRYTIYTDPAKIAEQRLKDDTYHRVRVARAELEHIAARLAREGSDECVLEMEALLRTALKSAELT